MLRASRVFGLFLLLSVPALARYDGPVDPDLHEWFARQTSHGGNLSCCDIADGHVLQEDEWRMQNARYQVFVEDKWRDVPPEAIVDPGKGNNPLGKPIVWFRHLSGDPLIDCFCPGTMG